MDNQDIVIVVLIISIILLLNSNEGFGPVVECSGAHAPETQQTCGTLKVNGDFCVPDKKDCFKTVSNEKQCYCKPKSTIEED